MLIKAETIGTVGYLGGVHSVIEEFCWSWSQMIAFNYEYFLQPGERIHYDRAKVSYHSLARNELAKKMIGDWLLQLDADHEFEPDILVRMLRTMESFKCDVLTALYEHRSYPHPPTVYQWDDTEHLRTVGDWDKTARGFQVGSAGGGTLLVKRKVFERIRNELKEEPFDIIGKWGEDHSFFLRCKRLGIKAFCAPQIESHHLTIKKLSRADSVVEAMALEDHPPVEGII